MLMLTAEASWTADDGKAGSLGRLGVGRLEVQKNC